MARIDRWYDTQIKGGRKVKVRLKAYGKGLQWEARWRDATGVQRKKRFEYAADADDWLAAQRLAPAEQAAKTTLADLWAAWLPGKDGLKPKTLKDYESAWRVHIAPELGGRAVSTLRALELRDWFGRIESKNARRIALVVLRGLLDLAVEDGMLPANPVASLSGGQTVKREIETLSDAQVDALATGLAQQDCETEFWVLLSCGLRFGEMAALRPRDVIRDGDAYRLRVQRTVQKIKGELVYGSPKSGKARDVPCPTWIAERLAGQGELCLPSPDGGPWTTDTWRTRWEKARKAAGLPELHTHDLRHTYAARQIEGGADLKALQYVMGHAKLSITVDLYGGMARPDLSGVTDITNRR